MTTSLRAVRLALLSFAVAAATAVLPAQTSPAPKPMPTPAPTQEEPDWAKGFYSESHKTLITWGSAPGDYKFLERVTEPTEYDIPEWRMVMPSGGDAFSNHGSEAKIRFRFNDETGFYAAVLKEKIASVSLKEFESVFGKGKPERRKTGSSASPTFGFEYVWRAGTAEYRITPVPLGSSTTEVGGIDRMWVNRTK